MKLKRLLSLEKMCIFAISACFIVWSAIFIYKSSCIAIDGKRYFCLFDDPMIAMRYAWNFSHGFGLVWNPGEYVEGYTNLLMTLIMSLSTLVCNKSIAVLAIQIFGLVLMLGIAHLTMRIADYVFEDVIPGRRSFLKLISFICALAYYPLIYWSLMGMETGLLTLLLYLGILSALKYARNRNSSQLFLSAIYLSLAFLTRNDSIIYAGLIFLYIFSVTFEAKSFGGSNKTSPCPLREGPGVRELLNKYKVLLEPLKHVAPQILAAISVYALIVAGQSAFRWFYYGELMPNTYTLKLTGLPASMRLNNGVGFISVFAIANSIPLFMACVDVILNFTKTKLLLIALVFASISYQIWVGGDPWEYWRMMSPFMPIVFLLFIQAFLAAAKYASGTTLCIAYVPSNPLFSRMHAAELLFLFLTIVVVGESNRQYWCEILFIDDPYQVCDNKNNVNIAVALNELTDNNASVGVTWAGTIPYYTGKKAIDYLGKCDKYIAQLPPDTSGKISWNRMQSVPGHNKYDLNYSIIKLQPTYALCFVWGGQNISQWATTHYVQVQYKGIPLNLLKDSNDVHWERAVAVRPADTSRK
jgi:arabinofuranosyltransferase